jgi:hypothetical protein
MIIKKMNRLDKVKKWVKKHDLKISVDNMNNISLCYKLFRTRDENIRFEMLQQEIANCYYLNEIDKQLIMNFFY